MIDMQLEKLHYDALYGRHGPGGSRCPVSVDNLPKARARVRQVLKTFGLCSHFRGGRVLDIGCGLGYIAEALRLQGASVVGVDMSPVAIQRAAELFPNVDWRCTMFPDGFEWNEKFDLVWILDISSLNTFEVAEMNRNVIAAALQALNPGGALIVGWHSDFSGRVIGNWSHWTLGTLRELRQSLGFSGPRVVQVPSGLSWLTILVGKVIRKSCPIYFMRGA